MTRVVHYFSMYLSRSSCQHVRKQCSWFCCCCFLLWDRLVWNSYVAEVKCEPPDFHASSSQLLFIDSCFICNSNVTLTQAVNKYWTNNSRQKMAQLMLRSPILWIHYAVWQMRIKMLTRWIVANQSVLIRKEITAWISGGYCEIIWKRESVHMYKSTHTHTW